MIKNSCLPPNNDWRALLPSTVKVNENATFVEDGMDDDIEFDDYSEEEEDVADIDAVSGM